jgi:hypothetical protein
MIPYEDSDFAVIKSKPIKSKFTLEDTSEQIDDPSVTATKQKKNRLATIHERLGHFSFARLKLLSRAGLIPKDLANIDAPVCPGCAYGKAHRKPWRHKGINNRKQLR